MNSNSQAISAASVALTAGCSQTDLARMLGISQVTVHRALSGHPSVKAEVRRKVQELAQQQGYRPNQSARAMRLKRFGCASVLMTLRGQESHMMPRSLLHGLHDELEAHDMHLMLAQLPFEADAEAPRLLRNWMSDGLLIDYISSISQPIMELIQQHCIPSIWLNSRQAGDCVSLRDEEGGFDATRYLLEMGHRRIAFVNYAPRRPDGHYSEQARLEGYEQAMREVELEPRVIWPEAGVEPEAATAFSRSWLEESKRPTAVVYYTFDDKVSAILRAAPALGLEVPRDLSIVTFGSTRQTHLMPVPLTTMGVPNYHMGREAVQMLLQKIETPTQILEPRSLPLELRGGESCVPPRDAVSAV